MILRHLGLNAQELETGPLLFLISHSIPVAYRDSRPDAMPPGLYRTDLTRRVDSRFNKAVARHLNKWIGGRPHAVVPHDQIVQAFQGISRFTPAPTGGPPSPEAIAGAFDYLASLARQGGR